MIAKIASQLPLVSNSLASINATFFSNKKGSKVQTVGFANDHIQNLKNLSYKVTGPIEYKDGKCLIFRSNYSLWRGLRDYFLHIGAMGTLIYCLYFQINFSVYPVIKHIYVAGVAIIAALTARRFLRNHGVVKEIYLLEGGKATQIVYQNQAKRKLFGEPTNEIYYNSIFVEPKTQKGNNPRIQNFPQDPQTLQNQVIFWYWRKHCSNQSNILLIPTTYNYIHPQIMVNVMKGKIIIF